MRVHAEGYSGRWEYPDGTVKLHCVKRFRPFGLHELGGKMQRTLMASAKGLHVEKRGVLVRTLTPSFLEDSLNLSLAVENCNQLAIVGAIVTGMGVRRSMASFPWPERFSVILKICRGSMPVAKVERATEQTGALEKAWSKVSPALAIFSILNLAPNLAHGLEVMDELSLKREDNVRPLGPKRETTREE